MVVMVMMWLCSGTETLVMIMLVVVATAKGGTDDGN